MSDDKKSDHLPEPVTLSNSDIPLLAKALNALDGRQVVVTLKSAEGKESTAIQTNPYKFNAAARLTSVRWLAELTAEQKRIGKANDDLIRQFADAEKPDEVDPKNADAFRKEQEALLSGVTAIKLAKIPVDGLKVEENDLPVSVLATLSPILSGL